MTDEHSAPPFFECPDCGGDIADSGHKPNCEMFNAAKQSTERRLQKLEQLGFGDAAAHARTLASPTPTVSPDERVWEIDDLIEEIKKSCMRDGGSYWLPANANDIEDWHAKLCAIAAALPASPAVEKKTPHDFPDDLPGRIRYMDNLIALRCRSGELDVCKGFTGPMVNAVLWALRAFPKADLVEGEVVSALRRRIDRLLVLLKPFSMAAYHFDDLDPEPGKETVLVSLNVRALRDARDALSSDNQAGLEREGGDRFVKIRVGDEVRCDRAKLTETAVLIRRDGAWIELRPPSNPGSAVSGAGEGAIDSLIQFVAGSRQYQIDPELRDEICDRLMALAAAPSPASPPGWLVEVLKLVRDAHHHTNEAQTEVRLEAAMKLFPLSSRPQPSDKEGGER